jgi:hypothetical protein
MCTWARSLLYLFFRGSSNRGGSWEFPGYTYDSIKPGNQQLEEELAEEDRLWLLRNAPGDDQKPLPVDESRNDQGPQE